MSELTVNPAPFAPTPNRPVKADDLRPIDGRDVVRRLEYERTHPNSVRVVRDAIMLSNTTRGLLIPDLVRPAPQPFHAPKPAVTPGQKIAMVTSGAAGGLTGFLVAAASEALPMGFGLTSFAGMAFGLLGGVGLAAGLAFGVPALRKWLAGKPTSRLGA